MTEWEDAQHAAQNVLIQACEHPGFVLDDGRGWRCRRCDGEVAVLLRPRLGEQNKESDHGTGLELPALREKDRDDDGQCHTSGSGEPADVVLDAVVFPVERRGHGTADAQLESASQDEHNRRSVGPSRAGAPHEQHGHVSATATAHEMPDIIFGVARMGREESADAQAGAVSGVQPVGGLGAKIETESQVGPVRVPGLDLEAIAMRCEAATRGPWQMIEDCYEDDGKSGALTGRVAQRRIFTAWDHPQMQGPLGVVNSYVTIGTVNGQSPHHGVSMEAADAEFIAHAREDIPALLAELRRLRPASPAPEESEDYKARYFELLYAVARKHAGESRHETALRYIRQAEIPSGDAVKSEPTP